MKPKSLDNNTAEKNPMNFKQIKSEIESVVALRLLILIFKALLMIGATQEYIEGLIDGIQSDEAVKIKLKRILALYS